jgi:hypothetical protein
MRVEQVPRNQVISESLIGELDARHHLCVTPPDRGREKAFVDESLENSFSPLRGER